MSEPPSWKRRLRPAIALAVALAAAGLAFSRVRSIEPYLEIEHYLEIPGETEFVWEIVAKARGGGAVEGIRIEATLGNVQLRGRTWYDRLESGQSVFVRALVPREPGTSAFVRVSQEGPVRATYPDVALLETPK